jgi:hypothetical protein
MPWFTATNLIPLFFVILGLVVLYIYFRNMARVRASEGWPASQGTILESWVREETSTDSDGSSSSHYYPEVRYGYQVMGSEYQGDKIAFGPKTGGARGKAMKVLSKYPKGGTVTVFYDPEKPSVAVLERNISKAFLVYGVILIAMGIFFYIQWS